MFTLVLCYQADKRFTKQAQETVRATYIPQIGSTISSGNVRYGTFQVAMIGQSVEVDATLSETVYVYLKEAYLDELI